MPVRNTCPRSDLNLYAYGFLSAEEEAVVASHLTGCAPCRADAETLARQCGIVAFELSIGGGTARAAPVLVPGRVRPRVATTAALAAMLLLAFTLHVLLGPDGPSPDLGAPGRRSAAPPAVEEPPSPVEQIVLLLPIDPDPALRRKVEELTARLREREEREDAPPRPALPPEREIEEHDWASLAGALLDAAPDLRAGRIPEDPDRLGRYLAALVALRRLAARADVPASLAGALRDPRTGPKIFTAVIRRTWPAAPEPVVARAEEHVRAALEEYAVRVETATTPEEKADAEENLRAGLAEGVEGVEETEGPPPVRAAPPTEVRRTADRLLDSMGLLVTGDRIIRGSASEVVRQVVADLRDGLGRDAPADDLLRRIAESWVRAYASVLARAPDDVVAAFHASLEGRPTADLAVSRLRDALEGTQAGAEANLTRLVGAAAAERVLALPTFFLLTR